MSNATYCCDWIFSSLFLFLFNLNFNNEQCLIGYFAKLLSGVVKLNVLNNYQLLPFLSAHFHCLHN